MYSVAPRGNYKNLCEQDEIRKRELPCVPVQNLLNLDTEGQMKDDVVYHVNWMSQDQGTLKIDR